MYLDASASILSLNETEAANFHLDHYRQYISGVIPNAMAMLYMYLVFNDSLLDIISYSMSTNGLQTIHFAVKYHLTRALFNRILSPLAEVSAIITKIEMTLLVQNVRMTKLQMMINSWIHSHQIIHQQRILHTVPLQNVNIPSACIHAAMMDHVRIWRSEAIDSDLALARALTPTRDANVDAGSTQQDRTAAMRSFSSSWSCCTVRLRARLQNCGCRIGAPIVFLSEIQRI